MNKFYEFQELVPMESDIWDILEEDGHKDALVFATNIHGRNEQTYNDLAYCFYGFRDYKELVFEYLRERD